VSRRARIGIAATAVVVAVAVVVVLVSATGGDGRSARHTATSAPRSALAVCQKAFHEVIEAQPTTIGAVRRSGADRTEGLFRHAFPSEHDGDFAAVCTVRTANGCTNQSAVSPSGAAVYIATVGCTTTTTRPPPQAASATA
jgi:hypothetical protein